MMPSVTPVTRANLINLFAVPTTQKEGDKRDWLPDVTVWLHYGDRHEEVPFVKAWWEGLALCAKVKEARPAADHIEFRYGGEAFWIVPIKAGRHRQFTFKQEIIAKPPVLAGVSKWDYPPA